MTSKNILTLLQVLGHPRDSKRISMLKEKGFTVNVAAFERSYHTGRMPDSSIVRLGYLDNRKYFSRILKFIRAIPVLRRQIKLHDLIYASGQDMAAMALIAGWGLKKPIVLEVGDIVDIQLSERFVGKMVRWIEKLFVDRYNLLVVISPGFSDDYYKTWLKTNTPSIVIENKVEKHFAEPKISGERYRPFIDGPLRIGYFGILRDRWSFEVLSSLAIRHPDKYQILFAGLQWNPTDLEVQIAKYPNMKYFGEYKSPSDLPNIYESVDMVWACYSVIGKNDWNLKWGRPNRFFEGCYFKKPTFAREGAHFAKDVKKHQIGKVIHKYNVDEVIDEIRSIQLEDFMRWQDNLIALPERNYLYTTESEELATEILRIIRSN